MGYYITRRIVSIIPVLIVASLLGFIFIHFAPGDPVQLMMAESYTVAVAKAVEEKLGLDKPLYVQYFTWISRVIRGDLGRSYFMRTPVNRLFLNKFPTTAILTAASLCVAIALGIPTGIIAASRRNSIFDLISRILAMIGISMPIFWLGILLLMWIGVKVEFFPVGGSIAEYGLKVMILPSFAVGISSSALLMRITRSSVLEELPTDYVQTAKAKGIREQIVLYKHVLKNAMLPIVTVIGFELGYLLGGAVLTETVFNLPGLGRLFVDAIHGRDYPVVQACILLFVTIFVLSNLVVDLSYAFLDPRIRYE